MKQFSFSAFLGGFIVCALVMGVIYFLLLLLTFDLGGGETLSEIDIQRAALLFFTLVLATAIGDLARSYIKRGDRSMAYGIRVVALVCIIATTINYLSIHSIPTAFNRAAWDRSMYKPFGMSATLVRKNKLVGFTPQQVKDLLGEGVKQNDDESTGHGYIDYRVENDWTLTVYFLNGKVANAGMRLPWLGI